MQGFGSLVRLVYKGPNTTKYYFINTYIFHKDLISHEPSGPYIRWHFGNSRDRHTDIINGTRRETTPFG